MQKLSRLFPLMLALTMIFSIILGSVMCNDYETLHNPVFIIFCVIIAIYGVVNVTVTFKN